VFSQTVSAGSNNTLIWVVVAASTVIVIFVAIAYTAILLSQASRVRHGDSPAEIRVRFDAHRPYSLPVNILVIGVSGTVICFLLEHMRPVLPEELSFWICLVPAAAACICALPVLVAILNLRSALR
jgi:hypothetical protein